MFKLLSIAFVALAIPAHAYTLNIPDCPSGQPIITSGPGGAVLSCTAPTNTSGIFPPTGCGLTQYPNTSTSPVTPGANVTLVMACNGGSPLLACDWSGGIGLRVCTVNVTASVTASYTATASNQAGSLSAATVVNVATAPSSGSIPGTNFCIGGDGIINVAWPASGQVKPQTSGFGNNRLAFRIVIPTVFNPPLNTSHLGFLRLAEVPGQAVVTRDYTVSKNSCDFQSTSYIYNGIASSDTAPYLSFTVDNPSRADGGATLNFTPGDVIYFNVRNAYRDTPTCPFSTCDISLDFATPNRY